MEKLEPIASQAMPAVHRNLYSWEFYKYSLQIPKPFPRCLCRVGFAIPRN